MLTAVSGVTPSDSCDTFKYGHWASAEGIGNLISDRTESSQEELGNQGRQGRQGGHGRPAAPACLALLGSLLGGPWSSGRPMRLQTGGGTRLTDAPPTGRQASVRIRRSPGTCRCQRRSVPGARRKTRSGGPKRHPDHGPNHPQQAVPSAPRNATVHSTARSSRSRRAGAAR